MLLVDRWRQLVRWAERVVIVEIVDIIRQWEDADVLIERIEVVAVRVYIFLDTECASARLLAKGII